MRRSEVTWTAYLLLGYFAYLQTVLGPVMPLLRQELRLSYSQSALHFSAFAAGMVVAGLIGSRVTASLVKLTQPNTSRMIENTMEGSGLRIDHAEMFRAINVPARDRVHRRTWS